MGWTNSAARRSLANLSAQPSVENSRAGLRDPAPAARLDPAERVAPSAPQPPGAGACRRFRSLLARVEGSGLGWCWSSGTTTHARGYRANTAKRIRSCCPGRRGLGGAGGNPTTGKVNCVPTSHPPPSDPPSSPLALALPAIVGL